MLSGWKTVLFAVGTAIVGALQGLDWATILPSDPQAQGWVLAGVGVVALVLRTLTTTPVGK